MLAICRQVFFKTTILSHSPSHGIWTAIKLLRNISESMASSEHYHGFFDSLVGDISASTLVAVSPAIEISLQVTALSPCSLKLFAADYTDVHIE